MGTFVDRDLDILRVTVHISIHPITLIMEKERHAGLHTDRRCVIIYSPPGKEFLHVTTDDQFAESLFHQLESLLKGGLQHWRRSTTADYAVFQDIVALRLLCIEERAIQLVAYEPQVRLLKDTDRQHAAWQIIREAIHALRPSGTVLPPDQPVSGVGLRGIDWPVSPPAPQEYHHYLVLYLGYVTRFYQNKGLARLLGLSENDLPEIYNQAIRLTAQHIVDWEIRVRRGA